MVEIVGFTPDQPQIVGFEPDDPSLMESISKGLQNIGPELKGYTSEQGMPLQEAVGKARGEFGQDIGASSPPILPGTLVGGGAQPVTGIIPEALQNPAETWKGVKNYIATKPVEAIGQAALAVTPMRGLGLAEKAAAGAERIAPELTPLEAGTAMKAEGGVGMEASKESGATIPASDAQSLLDRIKTDTASEYNEFDHSKARAWFQKFQSLIPQQKAAAIDDNLVINGTSLGAYPPAARAKIKAKLRLQGPISSPIAPDAPDVTVKNLHDMQQHLDSVFASGDPQQIKVATKAKAAIDDAILNMDQGNWTKDKLKYAVGSTVQEISALTERARYRATQLQAGNKEQALNTEFRNWARPLRNGKPNRNMRMLRGLSPEAADMMEAFAKDEDSGRKLLRGLGSMAPRNIQSFSWDHIGALLFHTVLGIHLNPYMLMGIGAGAKYLAGGMAEKSLAGIQKALLDAQKLTDVEDLISPEVMAATAKRPGGKQAIHMWVNAKGPAKKYAASVLARQVALAAKAPQHVPRIEKEINNLGEDVPQTNRLETGY